MFIVVKIIGRGGGLEAENIKLFILGGEKVWEGETIRDD